VVSFCLQAQFLIAILITVCRQERSVCMDRRSGWGSFVTWRV